MASPICFRSRKREGEREKSCSCSLVVCRMQSIHFNSSFDSSKIRGNSKTPTKFFVILSSFTENFTKHIWVRFLSYYFIRGTSMNSLLLVVCTVINYEGWYVGSILQLWCRWQISTRCICALRYLQNIAGRGESMYRGEINILRNRSMKTYRFFISFSAKFSIEIITIYRCNMHQVEIEIRNSCTVLFWYELSLSCIFSRC